MRVSGCEQTPVIWIRYNPVLEISIAAGIATATAIIALWKRHSLARVEASGALEARGLRLKSGYNSLNYNIILSKSQESKPSVAQYSFGDYGADG